MPKQRIIAAIKEIFNEQFGFEIYIAIARMFLER